MIVTSFVFAVWSVIGGMEKPPTEPITARVKWVNIKNLNGMLNVTLGGLKHSLAVIKRDREQTTEHWQVSLTLWQGTLQKGVLEGAWIEDVGTVPLDPEKGQHLFLVGRDGGTGSSNVWLYVVEPTHGGLLHLGMLFDKQRTEFIPRLMWSEGSSDSKYDLERSFLEAAKWDYGFITKDQILKKRDDPKYAFYFWNQANGNIEDGRLTIKKYPYQSIVNDWSSCDKVRQGDVEYGGFFKGGVVARNHVASEEYVIFHPKSMYNWPKVLVLMQPYLVIGTFGEGLAVINLDTWHLKRMPLDQKNQNVRSVEVKDDHILINGQLKIPLPQF